MSFLDAIAFTLQSLCTPNCFPGASFGVPGLVPIPHGHPLYEFVKYAFTQSWDEPTRIPRVLGIRLITCTPMLEASFEAYQFHVQMETGLPNGDERLLFRSERRACHLGEPYQPSLCFRSDCATCAAIATGFASSLEKKRMSTGPQGINLGHGVYATPASSKAYNYAKNVYKQSGVKAVIATRVVLGNQFIVNRKNPNIWGTPPGFHSVVGMPGPYSEFDDLECAVYNEFAMRPAFLILVEDT